jgi:hypothetical protein
MNKDLKHGLTLGVAFAALVSTMPTKAQDKISDLELCEKAVAYSVKYLPEENGGKLHEARWKIIDGERTDDAQKLISLVVFEIGQRIGYSYDSEVHGDGTEWIETQIATMADACEQAIIDIRKSDDFGEFESANPDEAW